ncbi:MAG: hypothetical protein IM496_20715 [Microcystis sp. M049S2]|uniref:hypothetical protein n=1 Tax=Microcystis sp. M049S2 TaxID=2771169 RepID=UPI00258A1EAF|nr:hypothetical protein [Microcystis sp. M049S2]MCA2660825.1 hypothetical protein [Microcystis sp. M049S2]
MRGNNTAEFRRQETGDRIRECGKWGSGEVGKWGSGEVGKWGSGEVGDLAEISLSS